MTYHKLIKKKKRAFAFLFTNHVYNIINKVGHITVWNDLDDISQQVHFTDEETEVYRFQFLNQGHAACKWWRQIPL